MTTETAVSMFDPDDLVPPAGNRQRFTRRWRLIGAGVSNVWRYGDLTLDAASGRLLLRGPNGTGKTTLLEGLWPYLLDLNAQRLAAGKARPTTLASLMREGATNKRRCGFLWLTLAGPEGHDEVCSYGVRLLYSEGGTPAVQVTPFMIPGVPLQDMDLYGPNREFLQAKDFTAAVEAAGGQVFGDEPAYVTHLAGRLWRASEQELRDLAGRLRAVRNPSLLGDVSPRVAADALRESLPGVSDDVVGATADALAESESTREAFERDRQAADVLIRFADAWSGHVTEVVSSAHDQAQEAVRAVDRIKSTLRRLGKELEGATKHHKDAGREREKLKREHADLAAVVQRLERSDAFLNAGRLMDLKATWVAQQDHASAQVDLLVAAAQAAVARAEALGAAIEELRQDFDELHSQATQTDPSAAVERSPLASTTRPRPVYNVGDRTADPGPQYTVTADTAAIDTTSRHWATLAGKHRTRAADAQLALTDHRAAATARTVADKAVDESRRARAAADKATATADKAARDANAAASTLIDKAIAWASHHPDLAAGDTTALTHALRDDLADAMLDDELDPLPPPDLNELRRLDCGQIVAEMDRWAGRVDTVASQVTQAHQYVRAIVAGQAREQRAAAGALRAQATDLRAGRLLPVPRPSWAGTGDDDQALATAVDWQPSFPDGAQRAAIEAALVASGLLGATISAVDVHTLAWSVSATGNPVPAGDSLASVLTVDQEHQHAGLVADVLSRVRVADTAARSGPDDTLIIGRDGTFAVGPLLGRPTTAVAGSPPTSHVGARQRRQAALARADELDREANDLDAEAAALDQVAQDRADDVARIRTAVQAFPSRSDAHARENGRAAAASSAIEANAAASECEEAAAEAVETARELQIEWETRTAARDLPLDITELKALTEHGRRLADRLDDIVRTLNQRFLVRLRRVSADATRDADASATLPNLHVNARNAATKADTAGAEYRDLSESLGPDADTAVTDHATAKLNLHTNEDAQEKAYQAELQSLAALKTVEAEHAAALATLEQAGPQAENLRANLRALLAVDGVTAVLFDDPTTTSTHATVESLPGEADDVVAAVHRALSGRTPVSRRVLRDRYDECREKLAGVWSLHSGETVHGLDTFVLTQDTVKYTPPTAAVRGRQLRKQAQDELDTAEESALNDFVIGRLPSAIGIAWLHINDWVDAVNSKMKRASASSGVGVRVSMTLSKELTAAAHTVYRLCCKTGDSQRTAAQTAEVGAALQSLIAGADGATMQERVTTAVDVRQWVEIYYEIIRPDGQVQRWTSKTGLSGGERRLVVLAPMLAAVAAFYDQLDITGLRLAALDEVPAEVDERGREGLARYIAELDLDLLCTSYLWDGAPGAWDGIDAWDLEAGPDGTVVAFPMLIRGLDDLPGDDHTQVHP